MDGPGQTLLGGEGGTHLGGPWISYELSSRHFLSSSASKNNCAVNRKTAEPPRVCSVTSRHFLSQASLGPVKLTQETRNREPTRSR